MPMDVIGRTEMPFSSIRKGYSLVPWVLPRYLMICSLRVEICSLVRWSSKMTQSETYSSKPWRVKVPSPRSPVTIAVTPLSFSQRNKRRNSARKMDGLGRPAKMDSMVSRTTRLRRWNRWRSLNERTSPRGRILRSLRFRYARYERGR